MRLNDDDGMLLGGLLRRQAKDEQRVPRSFLWRFLSLDYTALWPVRREVQPVGLEENERIQGARVVVRAGGRSSP